ncbi:uncharacterized protein V6R79_018117 [Siganus canaliculatus]
MEKAVASSSSRNTIRTDLSLLLECLKFQMKCPDMQKQALLTIHSICEQKEHTVDILREMGGVAFIYNLSKSSIVHSDVKETALFTLGTLAEANVYCKNSLCRKETFVEIAGWLMKEDVPLTQKRLSVYLLSVLVANNKLGQNLSQTTGCLDILLVLLRSMCPLSTKAANATQAHQLWASVSSALCGCVNNPQNEDGQRMCVAAFPLIKVWLQEISLLHAEIFKSICAFIAMAVANNSCVQESFSASGALDTLTLALVHQASTADTNILSCQLSVTLSKTLSACIAGNSPLASGLSQYGVVSNLFSLLASPHLDPEDKVSVLLTMGHCTEASEEHQSQLVQCGGLPFIITLLTDDTNEEVRKATTFILHTCKDAMMSLRVPGLITRPGENESVDLLTNFEGFKGLAKELLHRIVQLEKRQEDMYEEEDTSLPVPAGRLSLKEESDNNSNLQTFTNLIRNGTNWELRNRGSSLNGQKGTGSYMSAHLKSLEGAREPHTADNQLFKHPAPVRCSLPKEIKCPVEEELHGCGKGKETPPGEEHSLSGIRCAGCLLSFEEVTSRTFASFIAPCQHLCDIHNVLQKATEEYKTRHCSLLLRTKHQDQSDTNSVSAAEPERSWKNWREVSLTPLRKVAGKDKGFLPEKPWKKHSGPSLTPLKKSRPAEGKYPI